MRPVQGPLRPVWTLWNQSWLDSLKLALGPLGPVHWAFKDRFRPYAPQKQLQDLLRPCPGPSRTSPRSFWDQARALRHQGPHPELVSDQSRSFWDQFRTLWDLEHSETRSRALWDRSWVLRSRALLFIVYCLLRKIADRQCPLKGEVKR